MAQQGVDGRTSPGVEAWIRQTFGDDRVKRIAYRPFLTFFYPRLANPAAFAARPRQTVVYPADTAEVAAIMTKADELGEPVFVRQGTGLLSLDTPLPFPPGALVLDLKRLDRIAPSPDAGYVEVGPAVSLAATNRALEPLGFQFPIAVRDVQWGGLVSINLSGHLVDAYAGKPGDYVLGLTVVLPDGSVLETGTKAMRKVVGPDPTRFFVGGQALFGIITEIRLRLVPRPGGRTYAWAVFDDIHAVAEVVRSMYADGHPYPSVMELVDEEFVRTSGMGENVPQGHLLMLSTEAADPAGADAKAEALLAVARAAGARDTRVLDGDKDWEALWTIRESPFRHMGSQEYLLGEALDVPVERMREGLDAVRELTAGFDGGELDGVRGYLVSHIGAGTLHPIYACPSIWDFDRRVAAIRTLRARILETKLCLDATVGEQGIFPQHAAWFEARYGASTVDLVRRVKRAFDPKNLLNPGRIDG